METTKSFVKNITLHVRPDISDAYLIEHYGFKSIPWYDKYNLEYKDEDGFGLQIWWLDREINIIFGGHAEFGVCPVPPILLQMEADGIVERRKSDAHEN